MVCGQAPPSIEPYIQVQGIHLGASYVTRIVNKGSNYLKTAETKMKAAQDHMKIQANKRHSERSLEVGYIISLKLRLYRQ